MITKRFIENVHYYFDQLDFRPKKTEDLENLYSSIIKALVHTASFKDARIVIQIGTYCLKHFNKIAKMLRNKYDIYDIYEYGAKKSYQTISSEEAQGTYFITNALTRKENKIEFLGYIGDNVITHLIVNSFKRYYLSTHSYYISFTSSSKKMKLHDGKNKCMCDIVLSEDDEIYLKNNKLSIELIDNDGFIEIYNRDYISKLKDKEDINREEMLAEFCWDLLESDSKLAISRLTIYQGFDLEDIEVIVLLAASAFLLFNHHLTIERKRDYRRTMFTIAAISGVRNYNRITRR